MSLAEIVETVEVNFCRNFPFAPLYGTPVHHSVCAYCCTYEPRCLPQTGFCGYLVIEGNERFCSRGARPRKSRMRVALGP